MVQTPFLVRSNARKSQLASAEVASIENETGEDVHFKAVSGCEPQPAKQTFLLSSQARELEPY